SIASGTTLGRLKRLPPGWADAGHVVLRGCLQGRVARDAGQVDRCWASSAFTSWVSTLSTAPWPGSPTVTALAELRASLYSVTECTRAALSCWPVCGYTVLFARFRRK